MSDSGFLDPDAGRRVMRRIRLRERLLLISTSSAALLDRMNHVSQAERDRSFALVDRSVELTERHVEGRVGGHGIDQVEGQHMREQELLEGADLILQLLDAMLDGVRHGLFSVQSRLEPTAADGAAHRLSQGAK